LSIHQIVATAIGGCDVDLRGTLWSNIILTGGTTSIPGFPDRLNKELYQSAPAVSLEIV
jgi:actin-related protein